METKNRDRGDVTTNNDNDDSNAEDSISNTDFAGDYNKDNEHEGGGLLTKVLVVLEEAKSQLQHKLTTMTSPEQNKAMPAMKKGWKLHSGTTLKASN